MVVQINKINSDTNLDKIVKRWPELTIDDNHLKLSNNNFMLLDEITADLFI